MVKLDSSGTEQWSNSFGGTEGDKFHSVVVCPDGGYILAGDTWVPGTAIYNHEGWVVKIDSVGAEQWNLTYGGTGNDAFHSIAAYGDGDYILAGFMVNETDKTIYDGWVLNLVPTISLTTTPAPGLFIAIMCGLVAYALARRRI